MLSFQLFLLVLVFVNTIAEIVHSRVHGWGGQCNKNLGNAFVIIWRIGDEQTLLEVTQGDRRKAVRHTNSYVDLTQESGGSSSSSLNLTQSSRHSAINLTPHHHHGTSRGESLEELEKKKKTSKNIVSIHLIYS